ncbi:MAG TPA: response regulator [Gemmataceae bacterium]|nr:response regulator [Gemmataceae bacterium]
MVRILHVEDNESDRHLVRRELARVFPELEAQEVRDQAELDRALEAGAFDLTITDSQLKWGNGLVVLQALKARYPDRPVVMFTGNGSEEVAVEAMKAGLDDYVVKSPRHAIRLVTAVRSGLEKAESHRKVAQAEGERADLLRREQVARAEAERLLAEVREADRKKDEFLATLAHELRNPLSPIMNAVHLLRQPRLDAPTAERVWRMLERQVRHMVRLVDDLLDVSRIARGKIELRRERIDLAALVREAAEDRRAVVEGNGLTLDAAVPRGPLWASGDRTRLAQVVGNLLQNSAKFTDPGGRVAVRLSEDREAGRAVIEVEDTGVGIAPDLLPRVFEMFTQAESTLERGRGGLGIGLSLVKGLAELHGGRVAAASDGPGRGAAFTVWLPLEPAPAAAPAAPGAPATAPRGRVLVIEDSRDGAESLRMLLELCGHEVRVAYTGSAGVEAAKEFRPTVVLCDLGLPGGMDGYDVARALRQDPATAPARLIAVSGYGQPEDQAKSREAGFDLHLTKPVDPAALQGLLSAS